MGSSIVRMWSGLVDIVDHGCKRRRLTGSCRACDEDQATRMHRDILEDARRTQIFQSKYLRGNRSEHGRAAAVLIESIDSEVSQLGNIE